MRSVHLHIERLVVEGMGLSPRDRHALGEAVQRELGRLLGDGRGRGAWPTVGVAVRRVPGGTVSVAPGRPAGVVGEQLAAAIDAGVTTAVRR